MQTLRKKELIALKKTLEITIKVNNLKASKDKIAKIFRRYYAYQTILAFPQFTK